MADEPAPRPLPARGQSTPLRPMRTARPSLSSSWPFGDTPKAYYRHPDGSPTGRTGQSPARASLRSADCTAARRQAGFQPEGVESRPAGDDRFRALSPHGQPEDRPDRPGLPVRGGERTGTRRGPSGPETVPGLKSGRSASRESKSVQPVPDAACCCREALPLASTLGRRRTPAVDGMAAPAKSSRCDRSTWTLRERFGSTSPNGTRLEHHGKQRHIFIGPRAQAVLKPWFRPNLKSSSSSPKRPRRSVWPSGGRTARRRSHHPSVPGRGKRNRKGGSPALLVTKPPSCLVIFESLDHATLTTRAFKRANPARPYIWRLIVFSRFT